MNDNRVHVINNLDDIVTQKCCLPLKEWSVLSCERIRRLDEGQSSIDIDQLTKLKKEARLEHVLNVTHIMHHLVQRVSSQNLTVERLLSLWGQPPQDMQAEDVAIENFKVDFELACESGSFPREALSNQSIQLSVSALIQNCTLEQITNILQNSGAQVEFASPEFFQKVGIPMNRVLSDKLYKNFGKIFHELLLPESSFVSSSQNMSTDATQETAKSDVSQDDDQSTCEGDGQLMEARKALKTASLSGVEEEMRQHGFPISICRLVADLLECGVNDERTFQSLGDLLDELNQIINDRYVYLNENYTITRKLVFGEDKIYGRDAEFSLLLQHANTARLASVAGINNVILIGAEAGFGKTHLTQHAINSLSADGWTKIQCKFDRQHQSLSVIFSAFEQVFLGLLGVQSSMESRDGALNDEVLALAEEGLRGMLDRILRRVSAPGIVVLSEIIPCLRRLYPDIFERVVIDEDDDSVDNVDVSCNHEEEEENCINAATYGNRLHTLFQRLIHSISGPMMPSVFFVDDLQWADAASLSLLKSLTGTDYFQQLEDEAEAGPNPCFLLVGTYRCNEISSSPAFVKWYGELENSSTVQVTRILLEGISQAGTNAMISDALRLPIRLTRELAEVVHMKAIGNPLFVKTFLSTLIEDGRLHYNLVERRWAWDIDNIKRVSVPQDVALVMSRRLSGMPPDVQFSLTVVACIGRKVEEEVLELLSKSDHFRNLLPCLGRAIQDGVLEKHGTAYVFVHDSLQEAAYQITPPECIDEIHCKIGLDLIQASLPSFEEEPQLSRVTYIAIDQLNIPSNFEVTDPSVQVVLAKLYLKAGEQTIERGDNSRALLYLDRGLMLLSEDSWESTSDLTRILHEAAILAYYLNGDPGMVEELLETVVAHTEFPERIRSHYIWIKTLAAMGKVEEAINEAFSVLVKLGEDFPSEATPGVIVSTLQSTKKLLDGLPSDSILGAAKIENETKLWAMRVMDAMLIYLYMARPTHLPLVASRMVEISVGGLCKESAFGLASYALCFASTVHDISSVCNLGKLASSILDRMNPKGKPRLIGILCAFMNYWVEPIQSTAAALLQNRDDALILGDNENATMCSFLYCGFSSLSGKPLADVEKEMAAASYEMDDMKQIHHLLVHVANHFRVAQLSGCENDPFAILDATINNIDDLSQTALNYGRMALVQLIAFNKLVVAYFLGPNDEAADMAEKCKQGHVRFETTQVAFYQGLAALRFSRSVANDNEKWMSFGQMALAQYQDWVIHSEWNFSNKLLLLSAEMHFSQGKYEAAEKMYKRSIESARRHKFIHEEGLAMELFAAFHKFRGNVDEEKKYMISAVACYKQWGAYGLLKHVRFSGFLG